MKINPFIPSSVSAICITLLMLFAGTIQAAILSVTSGPTSGGIDVTINAESGEDFETQGPNSTIFVGTWEVTSISLWTNNSITFSLPAGAGTELVVTVTTETLEIIQSTNTFSYSAPLISFLSPNHGPTSGSAMVITGLNFGPASVLDTITVGNNIASDVEHSHITAECIVPPGTGIGKEVKIKVAGQQSNSLFYNYDPPSIVGLAPNHGPASGGNTVTVSGMNFGPAGTNANVTVGNVPATSVTVLSHTSLSFVAPAGIGANKSVSISIDGQSAAPGPTYSYDPPEINTVSPDSGTTSGGTLIILTGLNFGPPGTIASVSVGGAPALNVTVINDTLITCLTPAGVGADLEVMVTVGAQQSIQNGTFRYLNPSITQLFPDNGPTSGGTMVTVSGFNFGPPGTPAIVTINGVSATSVIVLGHTSLTFVTPPGSGLDNNVTVTVAGQTSDIIPNINFDYNAPFLSGINPNHGPTTGLNQVTISGSNFGPPGTPASATIGGLPATNVFVSSHTTLQCDVPPGIGINQFVQVTIDGQISNVIPAYNYDPPGVSSVVPNTGPTQGNTMIEIFGINFGPPGSPAAVMIGGISATNVTVVGHTLITCLTPPGVGINKIVQVTVGIQTSMPNGSFSYESPVLDMVSPDNGPTPGNTLITAIGSNFGAPGTEALVMISNLLATEVTVINDTTLTFKTPAGAGADLPVVITVAGQSSDGQTTFDYQPPAILSLFPDIGPTSGGTNVAATGTNFGPPGSFVTVSIDGLPGTSVNVQSHTSLTFNTPIGSGTNNNVVVSINGQNSNPLPFSYLPPVIANASPLSGPEAGGTLVTLAGINFGPPNTPISIMVGGSPGTDIVHSDQTTITFLTPAGTGTGHIIQLTVDGQSTNAPGTYSYLEASYPGVGIGTTEIAPSAILDMESTTQGILIPRMTTTERLAIISPAEGLLVYDSTEHAFYFYNGMMWKKIGVE